MFGARSRGLLLFVAVYVSMLSDANSAAIGTTELHYEAVDEQSYPWSSLGKLLNETGGSCSGVVISRDKILTAAHCLFNNRTGRIVPAAALHFLVGYRTGNYSAHALVARYEIGVGFDPLQYEQTWTADWAVLTLTANLPEIIEPIRLRHDLAPSGTKAVIAGYRQERAFAMTADRDCELRENIAAGRLLVHTCRSSKGYSGAPILVSAGGSEMQVAGIQIASIRGDGIEEMIAVPAQAIWRQNQDEIVERPPLLESSSGESNVVCRAEESGAGVASLGNIRDRLDPDRLDVTSSIPVPADKLAANAMTWLAAESVAVVPQSRAPSECYGALSCGKCRSKCNIDREVRRGQDVMSGQVALKSTILVGPANGPTSPQHFMEDDIHAPGFSNSVVRERRRLSIEGRFSAPVADSMSQGF